MENNCKYCGCIDWTDYFLDKAILIIFTVFVIFLSYKAGKSIANNEWKKESVNTGHAEYYLDQEYEKSWRWIEKTNNKEPAN